MNMFHAMQHRHITNGGLIIVYITKVLRLATKYLLFEVFLLPKRDKEAVLMLYGYTHILYVTRCYANSHPQIGKSCGYVQAPTGVPAHTSSYDSYEGNDKDYGPCCKSITV